MFSIHPKVFSVASKGSVYIVDLPIEEPMIRNNIRALTSEQESHTYQNDLVEVVI